MIYSVDFLELTERINPLAFSRYLRETGWSNFKSKRNYVRIFQHNDSAGFFQVIIPLEKDLSDYKEAMYRAIETVALVENKSIEQVFLYLLNPNTDILKIRLDKKEVEPGNILFDDAIKVYENAKKLLAATASDILHPKKYHEGRPDDAVLKFLSNCRFGQTEIGSYVIPVVCPFAELDDKDGFKEVSIFSDEITCSQSLTRQITNRVMRNIDLIKKCIDEDQIDNLVSTDNENMISANFYEALSNLELKTEGTNVEFTAEWAPAVKNTTCVNNKVLLTSDYYLPIEEAIEKLKGQTEKSTKVIGRIKKLESRPDAEKRNGGKITIVYVGENNKAQSVTTYLNKLDYEKAIQAHENGRYVCAVGLMAKKGKFFTMTCDSFSVPD